MESTHMKTQGKQPITRRVFLTRAAVGLAATLGTGVLAACSQPAAPAKPADTKPAESKPAEAAKPAAAAPTQAPIPVTAVVQPTAAPAAAAPAAAPTAQAAPAAAKPAAGGTLTVSQSVDINTLHPWIGTL